MNFKRLQIGRHVAPYLPPVTSLPREGLRSNYSLRYILRGRRAFARNEKPKKSRFLRIDFFTLFGYVRSKNLFAATSIAFGTFVHRYMDLTSSGFHKASCSPAYPTGQLRIKKAQSCKTRL